MTIASIAESERTAAESCGFAAAMRSTTCAKSLKSAGTSSETSLNAGVTGSTVPPVEVASSRTAESAAVSNVLLETRWRSVEAIAVYARSRRDRLMLGVGRGVGATCAVPHDATTAMHKAMAIARAERRNVR